MAGGVPDECMPFALLREIVMTNPTREELFRLTAFARCAG